MPRVLHIGIDAGSFRVFDALSSRGLMPNYDALRRRSGSSVLRSTVPWFTVPGWVSWMTGVPPEKHGMLYWTTARPQDYWSGEHRDRLVLSSDVPYPTIFHLASSAGRRVASINMPVTFPPFAVNGVVVSGFPAPLDNDRVAHPEGFLRRYPDYGVDVEAVPEPTATEMSEDAVERYASSLASMAGARARVAVDLLRDGYELVSVVFVGPDRLLHVGWPAVAAALAGEGSGRAETAVERYFRALDDALGELVSAADAQLVLVTSDHGQGPPAPRLLSANSLLQERGWLKTHKGTSTTIRRLVPSSLRGALWRTVRRRRRRPLHAPPLVAWDRSVAYAIAFPHCSVFGIVVRDSSESLTDEVVDALEALRDPVSGERPVRKVMRGADVADAGIDSYPDVLVLLAEGWGAAVGVTPGETFRSAPPSPSGDHDLSGVLVASGAGVEGGSHPPRDIWEVAPTILAALDLERPPHVESEAIGWIASSEKGRAPAASGTPVDREASPDTGLGADEEREIIDQLKGLGYLE